MAAKRDALGFVPVVEESVAALLANLNLEKLDMVWEHNEVRTPWNFSTLT